MRVESAYAVATVAINAVASLLLAIHIYSVLGSVPEGTAIRPMGLFGFLYSASIFSFGLGCIGALMCLLSGSRSLRVYAVGLLALLMAMAPVTVSIFTLRVIIEQRSLILAD
jgi:hypothetical protein